MISKLEAERETMKKAALWSFQKVDFEREEDDVRAVDFLSEQGAYRITDPFNLRIKEQRVGRDYDIQINTGIFVTKDGEVLSSDMAIYSDVCIEYLDFKHIREAKAR